MPLGKGHGVSPYGGTSYRMGIFNTSEEKNWCGRVISALDASGIWPERVRSPFLEPAPQNFLQPRTLIHAAKLTV
jgi:hypothetical protein